MNNAIQASCNRRQQSKGSINRACVQIVYKYSLSYHGMTKEIYWKIGMQGIELIDMTKNIFHEGIKRVNVNSFPFGSSMAD